MHTHIRHRRADPFGWLKGIKKIPWKTPNLSLLWWIIGIIILIILSPLLLAILGVLWSISYGAFSWWFIPETRPSLAFLQVAPAAASPAPAPLDENAVMEAFYSNAIYGAQTKGWLQLMDKTTTKYTLSGDCPEVYTGLNTAHMEGGKLRMIWPEASGWNRYQMDFQEGNAGPWYYLTKERSFKVGGQNGRIYIKGSGKYDIGQEMNITGEITPPADGAVRIRTFCWMPDPNQTYAWAPLWLTLNGRPIAWDLRIEFARADGQMIADHLLRQGRAEIHIGHAAEDIKPAMTAVRCFTFSEVKEQGPLMIRPPAIGESVGVTVLLKVYPR